MIKFQEIKVGDYLIADNDGDQLKGEVTNLNWDEQQVCVNTGTQDFWFETEQLKAILLTEDEMMNLKFSKEVQDDGAIKFSKGAFRMLIPGNADFSKAEIWYRDERRHITHQMNVHELQNHFYEMTKVHLNDEAF